MKFFIVFRGDSTIQILVRILDMAFSPHVYSILVLCFILCFLILLYWKEVLQCIFPFKGCREADMQFIFTDGDNYKIKRIVEDLHMCLYAFHLGQIISTVLGQVGHDGQRGNAARIYPNPERTVRN